MKALTSISAKTSLFGFCAIFNQLNGRRCALEVTERPTRRYRVAHRLHALNAKIPLANCINAISVYRGVEFFNAGLQLLQLL